MRTLAELQALINGTIQANGDPSITTANLTAVTEDITEAVGTIESLNNSIAKLTADNESLRKTNMDLFLKVGTKITGNENKPNNSPDDEPPKFESLFDDKGRLK